MPVIVFNNDFFGFGLKLYIFDTYIHINMMFESCQVSFIVLKSNLKLRVTAYLLISVKVSNYRWKPVIRATLTRV